MIWGSFAIVVDQKVNLTKKFSHLKKKQADDINNRFLFEIELQLCSMVSSHFTSRLILWFMKERSMVIVYLIFKEWFYVCHLAIKSLIWFQCNYTKWWIQPFSHIICWPWAGSFGPLFQTNVESKSFMAFNWRKSVIFRCIFER